MRKYIKANFFPFLPVSLSWKYGSIRFEKFRVFYPFDELVTLLFSFIVFHHIPRSVGGIRIYKMDWWRNLMWCGYLRYYVRFKNICYTVDCTEAWKVHRSIYDSFRYFSRFGPDAPSPSKVHIIQIDGVHKEVCLSLHWGRSSIQQKIVMLILS